MCRAVSNNVVSPPLSALFLDGTLDSSRGYAAVLPGYGPARKDRLSGHRALGLPSPLFRVIRRGIGNEYMVMPIPCIVLFAGAGDNGIARHLGARLPIGAVRGITAERGLFRLEDRSTSPLVRASPCLFSQT